MFSCISPVARKLRLDTVHFFTCALAIVLLAGSFVDALAEGAVIDSMDALTFTSTNAKAKVETAPGREGGALKFSFAERASGIFATGKTAATADWDKAAGFSFWVKGDGSDHLGGLEMIWNGDYGIRYACAFSISGTEWKKVMVPWRNLIPELSKIGRPIDPKAGNAPSRLGPIWFGKWWYWKDYAAHSYTIDDIRLEPVIAADTKEYRPTGSPVARVRAKIKAGKPITIVTMGDSLTDTAHWSNRQTNWPILLKAALKQKYGSEAAIVNPAMGGTELLQNLVVMPRWVATTPEPDLVTIFFGGNDWNGGMRGDHFNAVMQEAIDRVRRVTHGRSDILVMTTCPSLANADALAELAAACRQAAKAKNAGLADVYTRFQAAAPSEKPALFVDDKTHLNRPGQDLTAQTVLQAIERDRRIGDIAVQPTYDILRQD